jgi:hypothetical protein
VETSEFSHEFQWKNSFSHAWKILKHKNSAEKQRSLIRALWSPKYEQYIQWTVSALLERKILTSGNSCVVSSKSFTNIYYHSSEGSISYAGRICHLSRLIDKSTASSETIGLIRLIITDDLWLNRRILWLPCLVGSKTSSR